MTISVRLFRIEARRNAGLLALPLLVVIAWFTADQYWQGETRLWLQTSRQIAAAVIFLAPIGGGLAAWMASREKRRGMGELLTTTPFPANARDLATWSATAVWPLLALLLTGGFFTFLAVRDATWGGPNIGTLTAALTSVIAFTALGFAVGSFVPSRFTAPLVTVGLFLVELLLVTVWVTPYNAQMEGKQLEPAIHYLSPWSIVADVHYSVFERPWPRIGPAQTVWWMGLVGVALAIVTLHRNRARRSWLALTVSASVAMVALVVLLTTNDRAVGHREIVPYVPVCRDEPEGMPVCLHPAYARQRDKTASVFNAILQPLVGVPSVPTRAEQGIDPATSGIFRIPEEMPDESSDLIVRSIIGEIVWNESVITKETSGSIALKNAISIWLLRQAGFGGSVSESLFLVSPEVEAAADRFGALSVADRRVWLETHWLDLRMGRLTLDDLP